MPPHVLLDFARQGLFGLQAPLGTGGLALATVDLVRVMQQLAAIDLTLATLVGVHNGLGLRPLMRHAPLALRARWLPLLAGGRQLAAFAMSEPQAGSNPRAIGTRALRVDGGWRVSGEKHLIGLASWAGVLTVFARAFDPAGRALGTVALLVPEDAPGLLQGPEALTMGMRAIVQNAVRLESVFVPDAQVLGAPGSGMEVAKDAMGFARLGIGALCVGAMKRCAQLMARYAARREVAGGRLLDNPATRLHLHELDCAIAAGEALVAALAAQVDEGGALPLDACSAAKCVLSELLWESADRLVQMLGGRGYLRTTWRRNCCAMPVRCAFSRGRAKSCMPTLARWRGCPATASRIPSAAASARPRLPGNWRGCLLQPPGSGRTDAMASSRPGPCWPRRRPLQSAHWVRQRLDALRRRIESETAQAGNCPAAEAVLARVAGYAASIGDGDAVSPGEAQGIDPMLARERTPIVADSQYEAMLAPFANCVTKQDRGAEPGAEDVAAPSPLSFEPAGHEQASRQVAANAAGQVSAASLERVLGCILKWFREGGAGDAVMPAVDADTSFGDLGIDSLASVPLALELEAACGVAVSAELLYDYPTARALAQYVDGLRDGPGALVEESVGVAPG
ncbi:acyl-CoA dehydrogenase family protein [Massilia sp. Se16.2.3]|uniref:acyl-CoA dehydrogenase family protein n=1 Tax=Massilia sp. Se16.2.3 TaxID=2709303 RepID=UPI001E5AD2A5|nr:acyl-CoA dehydrogenase family protein [Massilia sp. Se16.2.3]